MATKEDSKVFDVAKPGKTAASETSKPVIVGHKPMAQDPMVKPDETTTTGPVSEVATVTASRGKTIQPVADIKIEDAKPKEDEATPIAVTTKTTKTPAKEEKVEETKPVEEPKQEAKKESTPDMANDPLAGLEGEADEDDPEKSKAAKQKELEEKELAKQEALQKLIDEKKYYLPIGEAARKRNSMALILVGVLLLVLVGAYLAIDAGVIKTSISLPLDLIKN